jgi:recombination protein U
MTIRYPNGKKYMPVQKSTVQRKTDFSFSNRGMALEEELNESNEFYLSRGIAVIHKKPVPIQVVNVNYPARSAAVITEAYFRTPSTTDFNGVWNGKYIDFEAKETKSSTSFPLQNIHAHQVDHMKSVWKQGGLAFFIIKFTLLDRYFIVPYDRFERFWERMETGGRKSITLAEFKKAGIEISPGFNPRIDYLHAVSTLMLVSEETIEGQEKR